MIGLIELDRTAAAKQLHLHRLLLGRERGSAIAFLQGRNAAGVDHPQMAADAEPDNGGSEAAVVEAHAVDIAGGGRRHALRRTEERNDGAGHRIAADAQPGECVVAEHKQQT